MPYCTEARSSGQSIEIDRSCCHVGIAVQDPDDFYDDSDDCVCVVADVYAFVSSSDS